jgi:hypothetical protein
MKRAIAVSAVKNFHLPLPENVYAALRAEAAALKRPATVIAREAIEAWLRERRRASELCGRMLSPGSKTE